MSQGPEADFPLVRTRVEVATNLQYSLPTVMDMVIFKMIFFELFSFLHVHVPYPPFRLLTNLGRHTNGKHKDILIQITAN